MIKVLKLSMYKVVSEAYIPKIAVENENEYKEELNIRRGQRENVEINREREEKWGYETMIGIFNKR